jgi:hypothetical protein
MLFNTKNTMPFIPPKQIKKCCIVGNIQAADSLLKRVALLDRRTMTLLVIQNVIGNTYELVSEIDPGDKNVLLVGLDEGGNYNVDSFDRCSLGSKVYKQEGPEWDEVLCSSEAYYIADVQYVDPEIFETFVKQKGSLSSFYKEEGLSLEIAEDGTVQLKKEGTVVSVSKHHFFKHKVNVQIAEGVLKVQATEEKVLTFSENFPFLKTDILGDSSCISNMPLLENYSDMVTANTQTPNQKALNYKESLPTFTLDGFSEIETNIQPNAGTTFFFECEVGNGLTSYGRVPFISVPKTFEMGTEGTSEYVYVAWGSGSSWGSYSSIKSMGPGKYVFCVTVDNTGAKIYKDDMNTVFASHSSPRLRGDKNMSIGGQTNWTAPKQLEKHFLSYFRVFNKALTQAERNTVLQKYKTIKAGNYPIISFSPFLDISKNIQTEKKLAAISFHAEEAPFYASSLKNIKNKISHYFSQAGKIVKYKELAVKKEKVPFNMTNVKIGVDLSLYSECFANIETAEDICFVSEEDTLLPSEIEYFDKAKKKALLWVSLPEITNKRDTHFLLVFKSGLEETGVSGGEKSQQVWEDFVFSYHMNQAPLGNQSVIDAATGSVIDATNMNAGDKTFSSRLNSFQYEFNGSASLDLGKPVDSPLHEGSLEVVFKTTQNKGHILSQDADGRNNRDVNVTLGKPTGVIGTVPDGTLAFESQGPGSSESLLLKSSQAVNDDKYHHAGISWYNGKQILAVDGGRDVDTSSYNIGNSAPLIIGGDKEASAFNGEIEHLLIDGKHRGGEAIRLLNKSMEDGLLTHHETPEGLPEFSKKLPITLRKSKKVFTAKSVVFDFADNWGGSYMNVRSIDFAINGNRLLLSSMLKNNQYSLFVTSENGSTQSVRRAFAFEFKKIGKRQYRSWMADSSQKTNQRICVVFKEPIEFDEIFINNGHDSGGQVVDGVKNTKITISSDSITDTTYNAAVANSSVIFQGEIPKHTEVDEVDETNVPLNQSGNSSFVPEIRITKKAVFTAKSVVFDFADNWGRGDSQCLQGIRFYRKGLLLSLTEADFSASATNVWDDNIAAYGPQLVFTTYQLYADDWAFRCWHGKRYKKTNQRICVVFKEPIEFDEIRAHPAHKSKYQTNRSVKNTKITISSDSITDTTYNAAVANSSVIFQGEIPKHTETANAREEFVLQLKQEEGEVDEKELDFFNTLSFSDLLKTGVADSTDTQFNVRVSTGHVLHPENKCKPEYAFSKDTYDQGERLTAAFDGTLSSNHSQNSFQPYRSSWVESGAIGQQFPSPICLQGYAFWVSEDSWGKLPSSWRFEASNTGAFAGEEVVLDQKTDFFLDGWLGWQYFTFHNTKKYTYYRVNVLATANHEACILREIRMFEGELTDVYFSFYKSNYSFPANIDTEISLLYGREKDNTSYVSFNNPKVPKRLTHGSPIKNVADPEHAAELGSFQATEEAEDVVIKIELDNSCGVNNQDKTPLLTGGFEKLKVITNTKNCPVEVVKWTPSKAVLFARLPFLQKGKNIINIFKGTKDNPRIQNSGGDLSAEVWKDFEAVYHFKKSTPAGITDATGNTTPVLTNITNADLTGDALCLSGNNKKITLSDFVQERMSQGAIHVLLKTAQTASTLLSQKGDDNKGWKLSLTGGKLKFSDHEASNIITTSAAVNSNTRKAYSFGFAGFKRDLILSGNTQVSEHTGFFGSNGTANMFVGKHYAQGTTFQGKIVDIRLSKKAKTHEEFKLTSDMWKGILLSETKDTAIVHVYPSFDQGKTYKYFKNTTWIPVLSSLESVHGVSGKEGKWHYKKQDNTWEEVSCHLLGLEYVSQLYSQKTSVVETYGSPVWTASGGIPPQGHFELGYVFDQQTIPSMTASLDETTFDDDHQILMLQELDLFHYDKLITGSRLEYRIDITKNRDFDYSGVKVYSCVTGDVWQECTRDAAIPGILPGMSTTGKKLKMKILLPSDYPKEAKIAIVPKIF